MRKVLVVHYSQTGQLNRLVRSVCGPLQQADDIQLDYLALAPQHFAAGLAIPGAGHFGHAGLRRLGLSGCQDHLCAWQSIDPALFRTIQMQPSGHGDLDRRRPLQRAH